MAEIISPKMSELSAEFEALQQNTKEKGERLFDAKRADLYEQSCDDIDSFVTDLERQIEAEPIGNDLTSVNILMQKQQMIETQMQIKSAQVTELESQADHLRKMTPEKTEEIEAKKALIAQKFESIIQPLEVRKNELLIKKEVFQVTLNFYSHKFTVFAIGL
jgi:spectrin beta